MNTPAKSALPIWSLKLDDMYIPEPNSGCWLWLGRIGGRGYGALSLNGNSVAAHRVFFELATGEKIPNGMVCDHKCRTPLCVNPAHLRVVTPGVNSTENSVSVTAINKAKTNCCNGHPFSEENTRVFMRDGTRRRSCRLCQKNHASKHWRAKAALAKCAKMP